MLKTLLSGSPVLNVSAFGLPVVDGRETGTPAQEDQARKADTECDSHVWELLTVSYERQSPPLAG